MLFCPLKSPTRHREDPTFLTHTPQMSNPLCHYSPHENKTVHPVGEDSSRDSIRGGGSDAPSKEVLPIEDAVQVKSAEYWLELGEADQALRELEALPATSWNHGWATKARDAAFAVLRGRDEMSVQA